MKSPTCGNPITRGHRPSESVFAGLRQRPHKLILRTGSIKNLRLAVLRDFRRKPVSCSKWSPRPDHSRSATSVLTHDCKCSGFQLPTTCSASSLQIADTQSSEARIGQTSGNQVKKQEVILFSAGVLIPNFSPVSPGLLISPPSSPASLQAFTSHIATQVADCRLLP